MSLTLGIIASSRGNIVPPLDTFGGAAAAYSTRLLSSAYGGSAVRVRRSFDNAEQDIGFSGGAIDETALMNFVGYENLFRVSQEFTSASWGKASVTITANAGTDPLGGNTASRLLSTALPYWLDQNIALTVGQSYTMSVWAKSNTGVNQQFAMAPCNGSIVSGNFTATNDWQRFTFSFVAVAGNFQSIVRSSTSSADLLIWGAQLNAGITAQPYQVTISAARSGDGFVTKWYTQDSNGENLLTFSEQFENAAWANNAGFGSIATVTPNSTTAPNSTLTADTITYTSGVVSRLGQTYTKTAGSFYTFSAYIKKTSTSTVSLHLDLSGDLAQMNAKWGASVGYPQVTYNFDTDAISSSCAFFGRQILPNGWVRLYVGTTCLTVGVASVASFQLFASESVFIWGAQLSQSSWLQPYQVTTTAAILRRDASQSTAANQPRIVGGGVIERENGKASIRFDGVDDFLSVTDIALPVWSIFSTAVNTIPSVVTNTIYSRGSSSNFSRDALLYLNNSNKRFEAQRADATTFPTAFAYTSLQNYLVASGIFTGSSITAFADSIAGASVSTTVAGSVNPVTQIGATRGSLNANEIFMGGEIGEIIVYNSDRTSTRADIERNIGAYYQTHWTGASSGLLDQFGGAAAAYSLRNLSSSYRGPLIRVRRSSDNAETDIGGTYSGDLDVASLLSFTGGQNLLTNSEDFTNAVWTKVGSTITANATIAPDGTLTADKITETAVGGQHAAYQGSNVPASSTYTLSFYAKAAERSKIFVVFYLSSGTYSNFNSYFDLSNGTVYKNGSDAAAVFISSSIQSVGNGWYRCSVTGNTNTIGNHSVQIEILDNSFQRFYIGTAGSGIYVWGAQLNTGILQPYIPTTTTAVNGANAFVTKWYTQDNNYQNLLLQSQTFENASWSKSNSSITQDSTAAPDGTLTADKLNETAVNDQHWIGQTYSIATASTFTVSFYLKAAERTFASVGMFLGSAPFDYFGCVFNLSNGTVFSSNATGASVNLGNSITPVGDGWYRCTVTGNTNKTGAHIIQCGLLTNGSTFSYLGVVGSGVYIWGAQLSEGTLQPYTATTTTVSQRRDAIQATAASQPRIVNSGGVESEGNKPSLFFDGTDSFTMPNIETSNLDWSMFYTARSNSPSAIGFGVGSVTGPPSVFFGRYSDGNLYLQNDGSTDYYYTVSELSTTFNLTSGFSRGSSANAFLNGVQLSLSGPLTYTSLSSSFNLIGGLALERSNAEASELVLYMSNQLSNRPTISSNINSYYQIYWQGNGTALLDNYSGASAAYSLRNLSSAYTGPLIRVRRSSDNVERDIYGTFGGDLDIASLVAFVGANSGFVTTWYDQSGNARNAVQGTAANQPRIVNAGVVDTENGKPAVFFDGTNDNFNIPNGLNTLQNVGYANMFSVVTNNPAAAIAKVIIFFSTSSGTVRFGPYIDGSVYKIDARRLDGDTVSALTGSISINAQALLYSAIQYLTSDGFQYVNGVIDGSNTSFLTDGTTSNTASSFATLGGVGGSFTFNGEMQEIILYTTNQLPSRIPIQSNINNYYKIY